MRRSTAKDKATDPDKVLNMRKIGLIKAGAACIISLIMFAVVTLSWFTSFSESDVRGMSVMSTDQSIDCDADCYHYIRSDGDSFVALVADTDDAFELMQYDSLFTGNNSHTYAMERLELTASDFPENGTLYFIIERDSSQASDTVYSIRFTLNLAI